MKKCFKIVWDLRNLVLLTLVFLIYDIFIPNYFLNKLPKIKKNLYISINCWKDDYSTWNNLLFKKGD